MPVEGVHVERIGPPGMPSVSVVMSSPVNAVYVSPGGDSAGRVSAEAVSRQVPSTTAWSAMCALALIRPSSARPL